MEARVLNYVDAMNLASILEKYILPNTKEMNALDFIDDFVHRVNPKDFSDILSIITGRGVKDIALLSGKSMIKIFYDGMEKNKIISLVEYYTGLSK